MDVSVDFNMLCMWLFVDKCVRVSPCFSNYSVILQEDYAAICWIMLIKCVYFVVAQKTLQSYLQIIILVSNSL